MAFSEGLNTWTKYRWTLRWNKIRLPFSKTFCYPFASSFKCIFKHFHGGGTPIHKIDKSKCGFVWKQAGRPRTLLIGLPFPTFSFVFSGPWDNSVEPSILQNIICISPACLFCIWGTWTPEKKQDQWDQGTQGIWQEIMLWLKP